MATRQTASAGGPAEATAANGDERAGQAAANGDERAGEAAADREGGGAAPAVGGGPPPAPHVTRCDLLVRFCETDLMGIVHHANYLRYFEAGRVAWLKARGVSYEAWVGRGLHLPVVDARLHYRRAARFDDTLWVDTWVGAVGRASVRFDYRIVRATAPAETVCEGATLLACVDGSMRTRRLPADVEALLRASLGPAPGR
jgi:acyl-CoA thioester hydrolase